MKVKGWMIFPTIPTLFEIKWRPKRPLAIDSATFTEDSVKISTLASFITLWHKRRGNKFQFFVSNGGNPI